MLILREFAKKLAMTANRGTRNLAIALNVTVGLHKQMGNVP